MALIYIGLGLNSGGDRDILLFCMMYDSSLSKFLGTWKFFWFTHWQSWSSVVFFWPGRKSSGGRESVWMARLCIKRLSSSYCVIELILKLV